MNNRENRTKKGIRKRRRRKKRYLLRFLIFLLLCTGLYLALHIDYFKINGIAVVGNKEVSDEEILALSELETGDDLFDVHPWFVQRKIKKNLYIESVNVNRKLPNKVEIIVTERTGKAQFSVDGKYVVTDNEGMVLEIADQEQEVTLVENIKVSEAKPKKTIEVENPTVWEKAMDLISSTEENDLYFKKLKISGSDVEAYVYDKLVCKGEYDDLLQCIESGALKSVVFDLYQKGTESGVINIGSNNYCSFTP